MWCVSQEPEATEDTHLYDIGIGTSQRPIVVIGAGGRLGRECVHVLMRKGHKVRATARGQLRREDLGTTDPLAEERIRQNGGFASMLDPLKAARLRSDREYVEDLRTARNVDVRVGALLASTLCQPPSARQDRLSAPVRTDLLRRARKLSLDSALRGRGGRDQAQDPSTGKPPFPFPSNPFKPEPSLPLFSFADSRRRHPSESPFAVPAPAGGGQGRFPTSPST